MYPHERSLVKELSDKPFVILGINSDKDREALKKVVEDEKITWRSWFDGGKIGGPIASQWNVQGWPTIYVIDQKGVIRDKSVGYRPTIDMTIHQLLGEQDSKLKKKTD
jgi:Thioredoxin-like